MVVADSGTEQGGSICPDIGAYLLGGGTICPGIRVRDMVPDNAHAEVAGHISPYGGPHTYMEATTEGTGQRLGLHPYV